jgi:hypothetical protein
MSSAARPGAICHSVRFRGKTDMAELAVRRTHRQAASRSSAMELLMETTGCSGSSRELLTAPWPDMSTFGYFGIRI